jgi:hypothetical protein
MRVLTITDLANLAISHAGISKPIQNLQTEHSLEAQMCLTWIDTARRTVLKKIPWSFATKQVPPALVATYPTAEWNYAYQYPGDALKLTRFLSWRGNNDTRNSRVPYRIMKPTPVSMNMTVTNPPTSYASKTGLWLFTNWPGTNVSIPVAIEYTFDNDDISEWSDDFTWATSLMLASLIVTTLTSGDPSQKKTQIMGDYDKAIATASLDNANEEQRPPEPEATAIRGRAGDMGWGIPGMTWFAEPAGFTVS